MSAHEKVIPANAYIRTVRQQMATLSCRNISGRSVLAARLIKRNDLADASDSNSLDRLTSREFKNKKIAIVETVSVFLINEIRAFKIQVHPFPNRLVLSIEFGKADAEWLFWRAVSAASGVR